jgi:hypothetical protein
MTAAFGFGMFVYGVVCFFIGAIIAYYIINNIR